MWIKYKKKHKTLTKFIKGFFILVAIYLVFQSGVATGVWNQKKKGECAKVEVIENIKESKTMVGVACIGALRDKNYKISKSEDEMNKWRNSYFWLRDQNKKQEEALETNKE